MHPCSFWRNERRLDRLFLSRCSKIPCMQTADYAYELPESAIAVHPVMPRSSARLLTWRQGAVTTDLRFTDLPKVLPAGTQLWVNNTRVIRARLLLQKPTGGRLEVFLLEPREMFRRWGEDRRVWNTSGKLYAVRSLLEHMCNGGRRPAGDPWRRGEAG